MHNVCDPCVQPTTSASETRPSSLIDPCKLVLCEQSSNPPERSRHAVNKREREREREMSWPGVLWVSYRPRSHTLNGVEFFNEIMHLWCFFTIALHPMHLQLIPSFPYINNTSIGNLQSHTLQYKEKTTQENCFPSFYFYNPLISTQIKEKNQLSRPIC